MSTLKVNNIKDASGGTSNLSIDGAAKAWVNFNGRNTPSIRDSFNVSSITDLGTGKYKITFTNALANANYAISGSAAELGSTGVNDVFFGAGRASNYSDIQTTTFCTVTCTTSNHVDRDIIMAAIFGD